MDVPARNDEREIEVPAGSMVTFHETRPGRAVLTERGNCEAWIAADCTVSVRR